VNREKVTKIEHNGTTVALDYGNILIDGSKIHIFATPGQKRFKFMRQILARGLNGAILVIDSSVGVTDTDHEIMDKLERNNIPYVIFANKQDINPVEIDIGDKTDVPIIPTIATDGDPYVNQPHLPVHHPQWLVHLFFHKLIRLIWKVLMH